MLESVGTTSTNVESAMKNIELEAVEKTPASIKNETAKTPNIDLAQYQPPSRPDTPTNMEDAETQYNLEDLNVIQKPKKKIVEKKDDAQGARKVVSLENQQTWLLLSLIQLPT